MLRRVLTLSLLAAVLSQPLLATSFPFKKVSPKLDFVLTLFITGSFNVLFDVAWPQTKADLDIAVLCGFPDDVYRAAVSETSEERFEDLQIGFTGDDLECDVIVYSFQGTAKKGNVTFRATGLEAARARAVPLSSRPDLQEVVKELKARKRAALRGN